MIYNYDYLQYKRCYNFCDYYYQDYDGTFTLKNLNV